MQADLFEWNDDKAKRNPRIHGVDFQEARRIFEDPFAITIPGDLHSEDEPRSITLGRSLLSRVLLGPVNTIGMAAPGASFSEF